MPRNHYGKGSVGTSMELIRVVNGREIKTKSQKSCDCRKCIYAIIHGECIDCYITGEVAVNKKYCNYFKTPEGMERAKAKALKKAKKPKQHRTRNKHTKKNKEGGKHN